MNKASITIVAIIAAIFAILLWTDKSSDPPPEFTLSAPLPSDVAWPYGFTLSIPKDSYTYSYILDLTYQGRLVLRTPDVIAFLYTSAIRDSNCKYIDKEFIQCHIAMHTDGPATSVNMIGMDQTTKQTLQNVGVHILKKTRMTSLDMHNTLLGFLGLLLLFPAIWRLQNNAVATQWLLIGASVAFLLLNHVFFTACLLALLYLCYHFRRQLGAEAQNRQRRLAIAIGLSLTFLILFKYCQEAVVSIFANPGQFDLVLPLGISYFIIRLVDTQMRWFRREQADVSLREFLCFMLFPGTLVAGPIETIDQFYKKRLPHIGREDITYMMARVSLGLFKKIVLADYILMSVMNLHHFQIMLLTPQTTPGIAIVFYMLCIFMFAYIDFSAYSDIAIGLSRGLGYRIRENFNSPLESVNIRDYWKRWHISLSDWCMRNVYFPLMLKTRNAYLPLYVTMLVVGLWHAFSLSWFCWALHHATGLSLLSYLQTRFKIEPHILHYFKPLRIMYTLLFVMAGFCFVWFSNFDIALALYIRFVSVTVPFCILSLCAAIYVARRI